MCLRTRVAIAASTTLLACGDGAGRTSADGALPPVDARPAIDAAADAGHADTAAADGGPPPTVQITVDRLPRSMNGSVPLPTEGGGAERAFRLLLPSHGFTVDVSASRDGAPADAASVTLRCSGPAGGAVPPCDGRDLGENLDASGTWRVPESTAFPIGDGIVLSASVTDRAGRTAVEELTLDFAERTVALDPFDRHERWVLTFDRDHWTISADVDIDGSPLVRVAPGPDGVADFLEDLRAVGLSSDDGAPGAAELRRGDQTGVSAVFRALLVERTVALARQYFDGVDIEIVVAGSPGAPDPTAFRPDGDFSVMGVGGTGVAEDEALGRATYDPNNRSQQDDSVLGLGIFTTQVVRFLAQSDVTRELVGRFAPGTGTPLGEHPGDAAILAEGYDRSSERDPDVRGRATALELILGLGPIGLASLICHEMGHSLGLVPPGLPPRGLFGDEPPGGFIVAPSEGYHIDTRGLNIMQSGEALARNAGDLLTSRPHFNPLNLAYLRRELLYDPARSAAGARDAP